MTFLKATAAASALALMASAATASTILIDDFDVFQTATDIPTNVPAVGNTSQTTGIGVFNLSRYFSVENTTGSLGGAPGAPGSGGTTLTSTSSGQLDQLTPLNTLVFSNDPGQSGIATIVYDGRVSGDDIVPLTTPIDLVGSGGNELFFFELLTDTPNFGGTTFTTTVTDSNSSATVVEILGPGFSPTTAFSLFGGIDFTDVTSLAFTFNTNELAGFDGALGSISVIPLPLSALLLLGGLGGLAGVSVASKRRRKSAA